MADFPSEAAFLVRTELFRSLGGFDEGSRMKLKMWFFLKALEFKARIRYTKTPIVHFFSQSQERWTYTDQNISLFHSPFPPERLKALFPRINNLRKKGRFLTW